MKFRNLILSIAIMGCTNLAYADSNQRSSAISVNDMAIVSLADFTRILKADSSVAHKAVSFKQGQLNMAGVLFTPANMAKGKQYPAIVVVHPGGGSKEQTASLYAFRLAQKGYIALAYDASHQGASEGQPRLLEDPTARVEDVRSAVDYLITQPTVDHGRIAALGICAGGGYAISATITDHRISAVASISAVDIGAGFREAWRRTEAISNQLEVLQTVGEERTKVANGGEPNMFPYVPDTSDGVSEPDMVEASEYYRQAERWQHKNSPNRFLASSIDKLYAFSAFDRIDTLLTQPLLLIAGSEAGSKWHSERAYALAKSEKELYIVPGGTHMSLYDRDVGKAIPKLIEFFGKNLRQPAI